MTRQTLDQGACFTLPHIIGFCRNEIVRYPGRKDSYLRLAGHERQYQVNKKDQHQHNGRKNDRQAKNQRARFGKWMHIADIYAFARLPCYEFHWIMRTRFRSV